MALINLCVTNDFRLPPSPPSRRPGSFPLPPPPDDWYATKRELEDAKSELLARIVELETAKGIAPVEGAVAGNVPVLAAEGGISDGGVALADLAKSADVEKALEPYAKQTDVKSQFDTYSADLTYVRDLLLSDIASVNGNVASHTRDKQNPHGVTAAQVGAYTKAQVDGLVAPLATRTELDGLASEEYVNEKVAAVDVSPQLSGYVKKTDVAPSGDNAGNAAEADHALTADSAGSADTAGAVPWAGVTGKPTKVSAFTNDSGYVTSEQVTPSGRGGYAMNAEYAESAQHAALADHAASADDAAEANYAVNAQYAAEANYAGVAECASSASRLATMSGEYIEAESVALKADLDSKADLVNGKVPVVQLPSYVSDVIEYDSKAKFPTTGEAAKIYVAKDTNLTYRWSGTAYVEISPSLALGETAETAYAGDKGKTLRSNLDALDTAFDGHQASRNNPHGVTAEQVGAVPNPGKVVTVLSTNGSAAVTLKGNSTAGASLNVVDSGDSKASLRVGATTNNVTVTGGTNPGIVLDSIGGGTVSLSTGFQDGAVLKVKDAIVIDQSGRLYSDGRDVLDNADNVYSQLLDHTSNVQSNPHRVTAEQVDAYTKEDVDGFLSVKQNKIIDLDEIRAGAAKGATALQTAPVTSVNGKTGDVNLTADYIGAVPSSAGTKIRAEYVEYNSPPTLVVSGDDDLFPGMIMVGGAPGGKTVTIGGGSAEGGDYSYLTVGTPSRYVNIRSPSTRAGFESDALIQVGSNDSGVTIRDFSGATDVTGAYPSINMVSGFSNPKILVNGTDIVPLALHAVPTTRRVNGKELSSDISISASDIDAYTKTEVDESVDFVSSNIFAVSDSLMDHKDDKANPHKTTAAQVGALPATTQTDGTYAVASKTTFSSGIDLPAAQSTEVANVEGVAAITPVNTGTRLGFVFSDGMTSSQSRLLPDGSPVLTQSVADGRYAQSSDVVGTSSQLSVVDGPPTAIEHGKFYCWKASSTAPTSSAITLEDNGLENEARLYLDYRTAASQITLPSNATVLYRDGSVKLNAFAVSNRYFVDLQWFSTTQREGEWESKFIVVVNAYKVSTAE